MLEVFDRQRRRTGILQNAFALSEELKINAVSYFKFSLPFEDTKNELCQPYHYIRYNNGELYRILPSQITLTETGDVQYTCEHVLALLIDNVLFGDHVVGNLGYYTRSVIKYVLDHQLERNWELGECDFSRQFEYAWSQESLLSALFSVPKPFTDKYIWTYDTHSYPYVLNLKLLSEDINPQMYIRRRKNMLHLTRTSDPTNLCTRLYPLGEGEGVNQLNIRSMNSGRPYLESPKEYVDKYGIVERVWIDRRYTIQQSLYDAALAMLTELQEPFEEYEVDFAMLGEDSFDVPAIGKIVEIVDFKKTYITGINYVYDEIAKSTLTIANKPKDIASTVADIADRQRIEMAYVQGATQFYQDHVYENATPTASLQLKLMIPASMKIVNNVLIDVEVGPFRKPFSVTGGGGGQTITQSNTTSSGASTTSTTADGGGTTSGSSSMNTSDSGGGRNDTTSNGGSTNPTSSQDSTEQVWALSGSYSIPDVMSIDGDPGHAHRLVPHRHPHSHSVTIGAHTHSFSVPAHTHGISHTHSVQSHSHSMQHTHSIAHTHSIPDHTHALDPGISYSGNPTGFTLRINNVNRKTVAGRTLQEDITGYLLNAQNMITRDTYHVIEIIPNDVAYVMLTVNIQGFIQSRGDATV